MLTPQSWQLTRYLAMLTRFHKHFSEDLMLTPSNKPKTTHLVGFCNWKELGSTLGYRVGPSRVRVLPAE